MLFFGVIGCGRSFSSSISRMSISTVRLIWVIGISFALPSKDLLNFPHRIQCMKSPGNNCRKRDIKPYRIALQKGSFTQFIHFFYQSKGRQYYKNKKQIGGNRCKISGIWEIFNTLSFSLIVGKFYNRLLEQCPLKVIDISCFFLALQTLQIVML